MQRGVCAIALAVALVFACPARSADAPPPDPIRGVANFLSNLLQTHGAEFRQLAADRKYDEAAELWTRERDFFEQRADDYKEAVNAVTTGFNERFESAATA